MKSVHYVQIALTALIAGAQAIANAYPEMAGAAHAVAATLTIVLGGLGILSGSALPPATTAAS